MEYSFNVNTSESEVAAGCLLLSMNMKGIKDHSLTLYYYSGYDSVNLADMVRRLLRMLKKPSREDLNAIKDKYSDEVNFKVSDMDFSRYSKKVSYF